MATVNRPKPVLKFSRDAWDKLVYFRDKGNVEVSGWGICEDPTDPLLVTDFELVKQKSSAAYTEMDDDYIAEFQERMVLDRGLESRQFSRIWIHTHPGNSASPSMTDEETFSTPQMTSPAWVIMFILAKGGQTSCRLKFNGEIPMEGEIGVSVVSASPHRAAWDVEYEAKVLPRNGVTKYTTSDLGRHTGPRRYDDDGRLPLLPHGSSHVGKLTKAEKKAARKQERAERRKARGQKPLLYKTSAFICSMGVSEKPDTKNDYDLVLSEDYEVFRIYRGRPAGKGLWESGVATEDDLKAYWGEWYKDNATEALEAYAKTDYIWDDYIPGVVELMEKMADDESDAAFKAFRDEHTTGDPDLDKQMFRMTTE